MISVHVFLSSAQMEASNTWRGGWLQPFDCLPQVCTAPQPLFQAATQEFGRVRADRGSSSH